MATDETDSPAIVLPESVRDELLAHAREGAPEEVCGILAGDRSDENEYRVETHHPAANAAETPRTRYEIDPREQLELMERIEDAGREVVGFYHSHPRGPAGPSATDAAQATWPERSYVIVSLGGENGAVRDDDGEDKGDDGEDRGDDGEDKSDDGEDRGDGEVGADGEASVGSWRWTGEEFVAEAVRVAESVS